MTVTSESESSEFLEHLPEITCGDKPSPGIDNSKSPSKAVKKSHQCDFEGCSAKFSRPWRLQAHKAKHLGQRPFSCNYDNCTKSYTSSYHLRRHKLTAHTDQITSTNRKIFKCRNPDCKKEFANKHSEKKHFKRTHEEKTCKECGQNFFKRSQLRKHLTKHSIGLPYVCEICKIGYEHLNLLRRHERGHVLHVCPFKQCMETFQNWTAVRKHLKIHPYDYVCSYCKKGYRVKEHLKAHIIRHMNGSIRKKYELKKFSCDLCQKVLLGKASLRRHVRVIHEGFTGNKKPPTNKPRAPRKDKGIPRRSFASILAEVKVPKDVNAHLLKPIVEEQFLKQFHQHSLPLL